MNKIETEAASRSPSPEVVVPLLVERKTGAADLLRSSMADPLVCRSLSGQEPSAILIESRIRRLEEETSVLRESSKNTKSLLDEESRLHQEKTVSENETAILKLTEVLESIRES